MEGVGNALVLVFGTRFWYSALVLKLCCGQSILCYCPSLCVTFQLSGSGGGKQLADKAAQVALGDSTRDTRLRCQVAITRTYVNYVC